MATENKGIDSAPIGSEVRVDWRSEREKNGWCRCGKREEEPSTGCHWHSARIVGGV